jgi:membrane associated rhomboid family serine protease
METAEIFRSYRRAACEERAFVLHAVGIASQVAWNGRSWSLFVAGEQEAEAIGHLLRYQRENPPRHSSAEPEPVHRLAWLGSAAYVLVLLIVGYLAGRDAFGHDWFGDGGLRAGAVRSGEAWRAVTALTLHLDVGHLLANLGFGTVFGLLAGQLIGPGLAWAAVLGAAALANFLNSMIRSPEYGSVGASTAVFATLGLLAAYSWRRRASRADRWAYRWAPLVAGVALLAFTGAGGERTDVLAHLTGFVMGAVAGVLLAANRRPLAGWAQSTLGAAAIVAIAASWWLAFRSAAY